MKPEWPLLGQEAGAVVQPLLPLPSGQLEFEALVAAIKAGPAVDAFARKRARQILTDGHTPAIDLEKSPAALVREAKARLHAFLEIVPIGRMNLPPLSRERCLRYVEISAGILLALWDRCQVEVPDEA